MKPSDAAPKPKKPPAPKAKKPDKSIWDSDSDTGSKKPTPALKGTPQIQDYPTNKYQGCNCEFLVTFCPGSFCAGKGRGRKRKGSGSEDEYSPMKKTTKPVSRVSSGLRWKIYKLLFCYSVHYSACMLCTLLSDIAFEGILSILLHWKYQTDELYLFIL